MYDDNHEATVGSRHTRARRMADERGQGLVEYALIIALVSLAAIVALGFLSGKINGLFSKTGNSLDASTAAVSGTPPANGTVVTIGGATYGTTTPARPRGPVQRGQTDCGGSHAACGDHVGFYSARAPIPATFSSDTGSWSGGYTSTPPWSFTCTWHHSGLWASSAARDYDSAAGSRLVDAPSGGRRHALELRAAHAEQAKNACTSGISNCPFDQL